MGASNHLRINVNGRLKKSNVTIGKTFGMRKFLRKMRCIGREHYMLLVVPQESPTHLQCSRCGKRMELYNDG